MAEETFSAAQLSISNMEGYWTIAGTKQLENIGPGTLVTLGNVLSPQTPLGSYVIIDGISYLWEAGEAQIMAWVLSIPGAIVGLDFKVTAAGVYNSGFFAPVNILARLGNNSLIGLTHLNGAIGTQVHLSCWGRHFVGTEKLMPQPVDIKTPAVKVKLWG